MLAHSGAAPSAVRSHEELFAYWASLRRAGRLPGRPDLQPGDFKRHLPTISLIDVRGAAVDSRRDYRMRLAGTGLYALYGGEMTGKMIDDVFTEDAADYWRTQLDQVVCERRPAVGCHSLAWRGAPHLSILWLRLPLARDGRNVDMILGYDALVGQPAGSHVSGIRAS
jgi:hypothetical protein